MNEYTNGLIGCFSSTGTDFNEVSNEKINKIEHIFNIRGRGSLGYCSPNDICYQAFDVGFKDIKLVYFR
ncbi:hypothetical protein [Candidatus Enterovibrio escicola]|uniref:Mobile element protein n=1 Tax=Candidatus Enterovibrio escicola TaxID=1927127 RepID=A0A2A5T726_9GAMM|nr:hypothetical protein [Candidatus Enterovibrio escacola]PCS23900.1 hypothetical protein BTN49_0872 [Candidatus Enterovibrio escacola]